MSFARLGSLSLRARSDLVFMVSVADARVGSGIRQPRQPHVQYAAPTNTAPKPAAPIERSMTQPGTAKSRKARNAAAPAAALRASVAASADC